MISLPGITYIGNPFYLSAGTDALATWWPRECAAAPNHPKSDIRNPKSSSPRVRMPSQRGEGAIDLLGQHDSGKLMWEGHRRERYQQIGSLTPSGRQAVSTADYEHKISRFPLRA